MFGNLQGWIISAVILVMTGGLIFLKSRPEGISKPTGSLKAAMTSAAIEPDPATILPPGTRDENAGDIYREIAAAVEAKEREYEHFESPKSKKREAYKVLEPEMDLLIKAAECSRMNLFAGNPTEVVNYNNGRPVLPELQRAATAAVTVAALYMIPDSSKPGSEAPNPEKGQKLLEAVFHLGRFLAEERVIFDEYRIGADLMGNAAGILAKRGDYPADKKAALEAFQSAVLIGPKYETSVRVISGIPSDGKMMAKPGDIFDVAMNSKEPMWQTEALLKLGRMRYMVGVKYGDQNGALKVLTEMAARDDLPPNVKAAAVAGRDLTVEKFRMFGN